jgi:aspartyl-tRNA synthetase
VRDESGEIRSPIAKFLSEQELEAFGVPEGSSALCVADTQETAAHVLGLLRLHLAQELDLIPDTDVFHWVVDFPLFKHDEETGAWTFMHHPFTAPTDGGERWDPAEPQDVHGQHYDLVWNGWELGSGSIRIHDVDVQERVFKTMGMTDDEAKSKFGFLLDALAMGAPPHGGFAMGIERFVALLAGEPDIRQIVAFPKVSSGTDPLTGAPTPMPDDVLAESGIRALPQEDPAKA